MRVRFIIVFKGCDILEDETKRPIIKVTIEKINRGAAHQRKYRVQYGASLFRCYNVPPKTVLKFIEENKREMSKVAYIFTDGSDEE